MVVIIIFQSLVQDSIMKKKKRRELDEDSEYSEDDRGMSTLFSINHPQWSLESVTIRLTLIAWNIVVHTKAKRSDDYLLTKTGRSMSPQPTKLNNNRHSTPKAGQV